MIRLGRPEAGAMPPVRLDGKIAYIRPPRLEDWADWAALRRASADFLKPWEPTWPEDALTLPLYTRRLKRQASEWAAGEAYAFLTFDRRTDRIVGGINLSYVRRGVSQSGQIGYWVGQPHAAQGYTSEATRLVLRFAFRELGLHRVEAACVPSNAASSKLLERVGFTREGYARQYIQIAGRWEDHLLFAMLASDGWE